MKKLIQTSALLVALLVFLAGCKDDQPEIIDTTAPTISNVSLAETVEPGEELTIQFTLTDDIALGEVRIDIHDDFDGHEHESARIKAAPFETTIILDDMQGQKTYSATVPVPIPGDAATGPYHLQINYFDLAGNEGALYVDKFEIVSEATAPAITITNFGADEELALNENGILELEGTIVSRTEGGLDEVHIMVLEEEEDHSHGRKLQRAPLYDQEWELSGADTFVLEEQIIPAIDLSAAAAGHYELRIMARDMAGNVKVITREIHVD